jgi:hypothetical protein
MGVSTGRDAKGRWLPGTNGCPYSGEINRLRRSLYRALTNNKASAIWDKMIDMAIHGDKAAAQLIMTFAGVQIKEEKEKIIVVEKEQSPMFERIQALN